MHGQHSFICIHPSCRIQSLPHPRHLMTCVPEELDKALRDRRQYVPAQIAARSQAVLVCVGVLQSFIPCCPSHTLVHIGVHVYANPWSTAYITSTARVRTHAVDDSCTLREGCQRWHSVYRHAATASPGVYCRHILSTVRLTVLLPCRPICVLYTHRHHQICSCVVIHAP